MTDAVCEAEINRYELDPAPQPKVRAPKGAAPAAPAPVPEAPARDLEAEAKELAARAGDLEALAQAMSTFDGPAIKRGARNFVFADGNAQARVMIIGEAPVEAEDKAGQPFVGAPGQMLDRMFAALGLARDNPDPAKAIYVTNVIPWRAPGNRPPSAEEIAMLRPFLMRHIELAAPDVLVLMGNAACAALMGRQGITRLRGKWAEVANRPALPMFHPQQLLKTPLAKREAWADLLALQAKLREIAPQ